MLGRIVAALSAYMAICFLWTMLQVQPPLARVPWVFWGLILLPYAFIVAATLVALGYAVLPEAWRRRILP